MQTPLLHKYWAGVRIKSYSWVW